MRWYPKKNPNGVITGTKEAYSEPQNLTKIVREALEKFKKESPKVDSSSDKEPFREPPKGEPGEPDKKETESGDDVAKRRI